MLLRVQLTLFLLDFLREDLVAAWYAFELGGRQVTLIVMHISDAVVVTVGNEHLDVVSFWIVHAAYPTWLIETGIKCLVILESRVAVAQPGEDLVVEGVDDLDFVIVCVRNSYYVLFWDKGHAKRVLQFCYIALAVEVTISVQILRVFVTSDQESRGLERFHINRSNGAALGISHIELDFVI